MSAFAQANTWKPVVVPAGGCILGIIYSPVQQNLIYARTDMGGAYRWDNSNNVWIPLTDWQSDWNKYGIESLAADPQNANLVYAAIGQTYTGGNGNLIASSDQGNTWTEYPLPVKVGANDGGNFAGERLAIDPHLTSILYMGSRYDGLWRSIDSGADWSKVSTFPANGDSGNGVAWVIFGNNGSNGSATQTIFAGIWAVGSGNSNIYRSTDAGSTWAVVPGGPSGMITPRASLGSDGMLWMTFDDSSSCKNGQIWKLDTSTLVWSNKTPSNGPPSNQGGYSGISVDAQNPQHAAITTYLWYGGPDKCFQTVDGGSTWTIVANVQNNWDSGPFPSYNINGAAWTHFCSPYNGGAWLMQCIRIDPFNPNNAIYTTGGGLWSTANLQASSTSNITWTFTDYGIEQTAVLFLCPSYKPGVFFSALGDISGMRYTNLDQAAPTNYCNPQVGNTNCIDYAENNANVVVRVGNSNAANTDVAFSTDNGQNWAAAATALPGYTANGHMHSVAVAADGTRTLVCPESSYGNPAYSTDSGASWTACNGLPSGSDLAADRVNASLFYATNGSSLYRSSDGGANFSVVNSTGGGIPRTVFGITDEVWVANGSGLFRFSSAGATKMQIANISSANQVGFGKAAPGQSHPALYISGTVGGTFGYFRCDDGAGASWVRINDNLHQYGSAGWCGGDQGVYGRMYIGTNGRGTLYCDSIPAGTPTITPSPTPYQGSPTQTQTFSPTPTATASLTPVCYTLLNSMETLAENGTWSGGLSTRSIVSSSTAPAGAVTLGSNCMMVNVTSGAGYNNDFLHLGGFAPGVISGYTQLQVDVYASAAMIDASYNQMLLVADCSSCAGGAGLWYQSFTSNSPNLVLGPQTLTYNISFAAGSLPLTATVSNLTFILNQGAGHTGALYFDNLRLVGACGVSTATPSATRTASPSPTRSASPSATPSGTASPSPTATRTPSASASPTSSATAAQSSATSTSSATATSTTLASTATASFTASSSPTRSATPSATAAPSTPSRTLSATGSPTPSATLTASPTWTNPPVGSTATDTPSISPTLSASPSPTGTGTPSPSATAALSTATLTAFPTSTITHSPMATGTATPTQTATATPSPSSTQEPGSTRTSTGSPTVTGSPSQTGLPTPTATPTLTSTAQPSFTASATAAGGGLRILKVVPVPNPQHGPDLRLYVQVLGRASSFKVRLYSQALNEVAAFTAAGGSGWVQVQGHVPSLPAGTYFVLVRGDSGGQGCTAKVVTLLWLP
jgi:hypothetical protein